MEGRIFSKKRLHSCTFMPSGIVYPKVDGLSFEAIANLPQHLNKSIGIAADPLHDSMCSLDKINPSKDIQSLLMLTPGINKRATSPLPVRGANSIIALRCSIPSNRWEDFWEHRAAA